MVLKLFLIFCGCGMMLMMESCGRLRQGGLAEGDSGISLKVLQFNIWLEGTRVENGLEKIADVIIASNADVVTFSEVKNKEGDWHEKILKRLQEKGHCFYGQYVGGDVGLISRYPIEQTKMIYDGTGSIWAYYLQLPGPNRRPLVVCSAHLDYKNYALYLPRGYNDGIPDFAMIDHNGDGEPDPVLDVEAIQANNEESLKDEAVLALIQFIEKNVSADTSVILAGDFNDGSHLDWTARAGGMFDHHDLVIPWKNSLRLQKAGFIDAYRKIYPDEVSYPGVTWPSVADGRGTTSWASKSDERDRIDFVYYKGDTIFPRAASLVGSRYYWLKDRKVANESEDRFICEELPWPSDHKGVMVEFKLK